MTTIPDIDRDRPAGLPNIDRDRLNGFRRMANNVLDDMLEAALDAAGRHEHQVDLLKARVAEQDQDAADVASHMGAMNKALGAALGEEHGTLGGCVYSAIEFIGRAQHRITEVQKHLDKAATEAAPEFFGLTIGDLAEVLKEEAEGEDNAAVKKCLVLDDGDISVVDTIRELCAQLRFLDNAVGNLQPEKPVLCGATKTLVASGTRNYLATTVADVRHVADLPLQTGPWVITRKDAHGRRFWAPFPSGEGNSWTPNVLHAKTFPDASAAERSKPRGSRVVTLAETHELIEADKVVRIAPSADAPGPEAA